MDGILGTDGTDGTDGIDGIIGAGIMVGTMVGILAGTTGAGLPGLSFK